MIKTFNNLPIYKAFIADLTDGILDISLVDDPAVSRDFVLFSKAKTNFQIQDEEKRIVSGVIMLANTPIYRRSEELGEYYIVYTPEVIRAMVEKMSADGRFNNITLNHDGNLVEGVTLVEIFIKDSSKGISPNYIEDVPEGSLLASYKVNNEAIWKSIKEGTFKGFSLSGIFDLEPEKSELDELLDLLAQVKVKYHL